MCRSVRQTPQALTRTRISPGPGTGAGRASGPGSLPARSRHELLRAREVRGVDHLTLEREGVHTPPGVLVEQRDQLARLLDRFLRRREDLVDHGNLVGMDRDLAGEAHRRSVLALTPQA